MTLYMIELGVSDWSAALAWYRDVLGLPVALLDEPHVFALMGGQGGRMALLGENIGSLPGRHRLAFEVDDLGASHQRLRAAGVPVGEILEDAEGYRSFRLEGPEKTPIRIFAWSVRDRAPTL